MTELNLAWICTARASDMTALHTTNRTNISHYISYLTDFCDPSWSQNMQMNAITAYTVVPGDNEQ